MQQRDAARPALLLTAVVMLEAAIPVLLCLNINLPSFIAGALQEITWLPPIFLLTELISSSLLVGSAAADCPIHQLDQQGFAGFRLQHHQREHYSMATGGWVSFVSGRFPW